MGARHVRRQRLQWMLHSELAAFWLFARHGGKYRGEVLRIPQCGIWADLLADRRWLSNSHERTIPSTHSSRKWGMLRLGWSLCWLRHRWYWMVPRSSMQWRATGAPSCDRSCLLLGRMLRNMLQTVSE